MTLLIKKPISSLLLLFIILFLFRYPSTSQSINIDSDISEKYFEGLSNVASSIISDSFTPMTHYKEGDMSIHLVPAWFNISTLHDDPKIEGENLRGYPISINYPELEFQTRDEISTPSPALYISKETIKHNRINRGMIGLNFEILSDKSLSISIDMGTIISSYTKVYNKKFPNGLEMNSIVAALVYRGSLGENMTKRSRYEE